MKNNNKLLTGLAAGAAAGLLTFLFVKPRLSNKPKPEVADEAGIKEAVTSNSEDLFI